MFNYITVSIETGHVSCYNTIAGISIDLSLSESIIRSAIENESLISRGGGSKTCFVYIWSQEVGDYHLTGSFKEKYKSRSFVYQ